MRYVGDMAECRERDHLPMQPTATEACKRQSMHATIHEYLRNRTLIRSSTAPDFYKGPEDALHFAQVYHTTTQFSSPSVSGEKIIVSHLLGQLTQYFKIARTLYALGHQDTGLALLTMCCQRHKAFLSSSNLSLIPWITVGAIITASRVGVESFMAFVLKETLVVHGDSHPLSIMYQKLAAVGSTDNFFRCLASLLQYYMGTHTYIGSQPYIWDGEWYYDLINKGAVDANMQLNEIEHLQRHLRYHVQQYLQGRPDSRHTNLAHAQALQCRIAWVYYSCRRYEEATAVASELLSEPVIDTRVVSEGGCHDILYKIAMAENKHDAALDALHKAVETAVEGYGYGHSMTADKTARLESHLRSMGRVSEADEVRKDLENQVKQICIKVQRLQLQDT